VLSLFIEVLRYGAVVRPSCPQVVIFGLGDLP
jgi:hypothetical protein